MIAALAPETSALTRHVLATDEESDLIRRAQARDQQAFARLYRSHVGRIHALCRRMAGDVAHAEELTQTVFVTLWEKLSHFRGESAFSTWLHRLAVNTVLMDFRTTRRREARIFGTADPAALETPPPAASPGARLDLEQAIAVLPPQARAVFVLHDVEGYTHEEIAGLLELQTGTTKAQLHRARQLLQEALR
ncbi:MAG TPA: sigma-70 family RNA polymerase sigma factor [Lacunisphaera sp.]|nr:sigma-70 family RNA polymerase sigma factor [Lacunisphaera sp.]